MSNANTQTTPQGNGRVLPNIGDLEAEIAALKAKLAGRAAGKLSFKVADKGGLSVYGLQRFPVTLYASGWESLLTAANVAAVIKAIADNEGTGDGDPDPHPGVDKNGKQLEGCTTLKRK